MNLYTSRNLYTSHNLYLSGQMANRSPHNTPLSSENERPIVPEIPARSVESKTYAPRYSEKPRSSSKRKQ